MMHLGGGSAWTCCFGEDPVGHLGLLRHTGVAICASGAITIRRLSSETRLKSDAEMTDHCGRRHAYGGSSGCTGNMENVAVQIWSADFAFIWQKMRTPRRHEGLQAPFHPAWLLMERLTKIAFYVGIGIAVSVFALFLIWSLPVVIGHTGNQWERLGNTDTDRSNGETLAKFQGHPAYVAMYERFPGAVEKVEYLEDGGGSIEVGAMNFENNGQLVLHMYYIYSNDVHAEVTCMNDAMDRQTHVDDLLAERFIRNTDCLDTVGDAGT